MIEYGLYCMGKAAWRGNEGGGLYVERKPACLAFHISKQQVRGCIRWAIHSFRRYIWAHG